MSELKVGRVEFGPTPGPWEMVQVGGSSAMNHYGVMASGDLKVALLSSRDELAEAEANARLIAAAPELLAVLKEWASLDREESLDLLDRTQAAIAKAEGR